MPSLDPETYLASIAADGAAMAALAGGDTSVRVPACPEWSLADLLGHMGVIHRWATATVATRATERLKRSEIPGPPEGDGLGAWFAEGVDALIDALRSTDPDTAVWTFGGEQRAGFWYRRMAQETAVHRWDGEQAADSSVAPRPIDAAIACDGIDELLDVFVPALQVEQRLGGPHTMHLHATNAPGEWMLHIDQNGFRVERTHGKGDVAARGPASDLLLFLWGRVGPDALDVFGDRALLDRWQEAVRL